MMCKNIKLSERIVVIVGDDSSADWLVLSDESVGDDDGECQPGSKCPRVSLILMDYRPAKLTPTKLPAEFSFTDDLGHFSSWW